MNVLTINNSNALYLQPLPQNDYDFVTHIQELEINLVRALDGSWACNFASQIKAIPVICNVGHIDTKQYNQALKKVSHVWPLSYKIAETAVSFGVSPQQIYLLSYRVDTQFFKRITETHPRYEEIKLEFLSAFHGRYRILYVGSKLGENGKSLLRALSILGSDYVGIFVGAGNTRLFKEYLKNYEESINVHVLEGLSDEKLVEYLTFVDVYCNPDQGIFGESRPFFLEPLATQTPTILKNQPPINEMATNGKDLLFIENSNDEKEIAQQIQNLVSNPKLQSTLQANSRATALKYDRFIIDKWEGELYRLALNQKKKKSKASL